MGFLDKLKSTYDASTYVKGAGKMLGIGQTPEVDAGPGAEGLRDQMQKQTAYAKQLQQSSPGLMERQAAIQRGSARGALANAMAGNRQNFQSRGLLFSGLRKGAEGGIQSEVGSNLAGGIAGSNRAVMDQVNEARQNAIQTGQRVADIEQQRESNRMNAMMEALGKRGQALSSLGSGLGSAAGTVAGKMG